MKDFQGQIENWQRNQKKIALARVIQTWGSSPRPVGSVMLISSDLEIVGSVSGGCVEGAVVKEAKTIFETSKSKRIAYGVTDDDAWAVGLSCGGKIQLYVQPWTTENVFAELNQKLSNNEGCVLVTSLTEGVSRNTLIDKIGKSSTNDLSPTLIENAKQAYAKRTNQTITENGIEYFIHVFPPRSKMIIIGAAHITADLVKLAHEFDFETIVIDPRGTFAKNTTFAIKPDQLFEKYPSEVLNDFELDQYTYAVILSHDPKIDDDALQILLRKNVAYIGALGSKKNHEKRTIRLLEKGFTPEEISRIDAPIGLDINAKGAKEIAFSIMGAIIKAKNLYL
jgi:xanthine dehydrogenase accessory factor